jgi:RNA polymerase sigma-70 factor (ECF subfamily)
MTVDGMDKLDDIKLIDLYKKGDLKALDVLVLRYRRQVFSYIINMMGTPGEADEVFQEVWLKVIRKVHRYRNKNFFGWLIRITHNTVIDSIRRRKPNMSLEAEHEEGASLSDVLPDDGPAPHAELLSRELGDIVKSEVAKLPQEQREVFILRTQAELAFKEIALIQGTSINTTLARMQYALSKLREPLRDCYQELNQN